MSTLVADASGLVSLGVVAGDDPDPLALCLDSYDVVVPAAVVEELREVASYDDDHGRAAAAVLDRTDAFDTRSVALDGDFPLDDGENAAVTLANDIDAALLLCDEFIDLLPRLKTRESHHGISGPALRPVGFKTHTFHTSPAGFQHRCGCLVARSTRPHP